MLFSSLALTDIAPAVGAETTGTSGTSVAESTRTVSEEPESSKFWFNRNALDLNVYGLAYHPDREAVHRKNLDNQVNPGLSLHYELTNSERGLSFAEAGAYYDSGRHWAKFLSLGYQFKFGEHWRVGGAVAAVHSATYNNGVAFVGMFPLVTYDLGPVKLNAVYFPKVANYNKIAAFGFYLSIPLGRWLE